MTNGTDVTNTPQPQSPAAPPQTPAPVQATPQAAVAPASEDAVMAKLASAAALATALAQNPDVLTFMTALVGAGGPQPSGGSDGS